MNLPSREQVREIDRLAIEELGIPGIVLMENAAMRSSDAILDLVEGEMHVIAQDAEINILCGGGNNGGDGYAIGRHLSNAGAKVTCWACVHAGDLSGDAATNYAIAAKLGIVEPLDTEDLVAAALAANRLSGHVNVDAMLGTGFHGDVRSPIAHIIDASNALREKGGKTVAIDVPSGLDCNTGEAADPTIRADVTLTFIAAKRGFATETAQSILGELQIVDIGAPPALVAKVLNM